jgi:hypothetical protein
MKKLISIICIIGLTLITSISFAGGGKVQERNPEIRGAAEQPVMRQLITNGDV